jgi:hypothetical protein
MLVQVGATIPLAWTLSGPSVSVSVDGGALSAAHSKGRVVCWRMAARSWETMEIDP